MKIIQISVFLENVIGRIGEVTKALSAADVNMQAISIADTKDFGILRLIVSDNDLAMRTLSDAGFTVKETPVAAVEIEDHPGSLAEVLELFEKNEVNIEYLYTSFMRGKGEKAVIIIKLENYDKGMKLIMEKGIAYEV